MHGLVLRFDIDSGREAESVEFVEANVLPRVRQVPWPGHRVLVEVH